MGPQRQALGIQTKTSAAAPLTPGNAASASTPAWMGNSLHE
jgi:hypothetical protein